MLKAVIIDENATSRSLLQTILINNGWEVVGQTSSNSKGLGMVQKFQPHFVCIDIQQINDEIDILQMLRTEWPKTLVFLTSSEVSAETVQNAVTRGVHGFFLKPFNQVTVANTIRSAVLRLIKSQQAQHE